MSLIARGGRRVRLFMWHLYSDYSTVMMDIVASARENQTRTWLQAAGVVGVCAAIATNPTLDDYADALVCARGPRALYACVQRSRRCAMSIVSTSEQNEHARSLLHDCTALVSEQRLHRLNLFVASVLFRLPAPACTCVVTEANANVRLVFGPPTHTHPRFGRPT
jgi:hypothetical protein